MRNWQRTLLFLYQPKMATIVESSMDKVGEAAEQEYEATLVDESSTNAKPKRIRLSTGQRMRLVEDFRRGKLDKYYSVTIDKKRPGEFRITKRRKPLDTPEIEVTAAPVLGEGTLRLSPDDIPVPPATTIQALPGGLHLNSQGEITEPTPLPTKPRAVEKPEKVNIEFYAMQNNINNSLSREIQAVMEKCNKIERKMKEQRAEAKAKRKAQPPPALADFAARSCEAAEYEYEYSDGDEPPQAQAPMQPEPALPASRSPLQAAEQIQLMQPNQYRAFNARSRINLLRDFR